MSALGSELHAVVQHLVKTELAGLRSELAKRFTALEQKLCAQLEEQKRASQQLLTQVRMREERTDFVHAAKASGVETGGRGSAPGRICIEVGSDKFVTTTEILSGQGHPDASARDSYFTALLSGRWCSSLFVARSSASFRFILEYLTYHALHNHPKDAPTFELLVQDADFYGLKELYARLSTSVAKWGGVGSYGGMWQWHSQWSTARTAQHTTDASGSRVIVQRPGAYLVFVRDNQEPHDGQRRLELRTAGLQRAVLQTYTADGPVSTQLAQLLVLHEGEDLCVRSDAPVVEDRCVSMSLVLLNDSFLWGVWQGTAYDRCWQWRGVQGTLSGLEVEAEGPVVQQAGHYLVAVRDVQEANGEKTLHVWVDRVVVASSFCNTGCDGRNSRSTAFLFQLVELQAGERLRVVSDSPVQDEAASLFLVRLPGSAVCASWQAVGRENTLLRWGHKHAQGSAGDFALACGGTAVHLERTGNYLVAVRAVHGGNSRKVLRLLHNATAVATSHATTDGIHRNGGHIIEAIMATAGDVLSVICQDSVDDSGASTNLSIVLLST